MSDEGLLVLFYDALRQRGESLKLKPVDLQPEQEVPAAALLNDAQMETTKIKRSISSLTMRTLELGMWTVVVGMIENGASGTLREPAGRRKVLEQWGEFQRSAAILRTRSEKSRQDDISLILIGPIGSAGDGEWVALASQIERDDRVCRKLVWLPTSSVESHLAEASLFLERTFLARPWIPTEAIFQPKLDEADRSLETLSQWQQILDGQPLDEEDMDYDDLAKALINSYQP